MANMTGTGGSERANFYLEDVLVGRRQQINFKAGSNITIVAVEDADRHEVAYTITATSGGGVTDHSALTGVTATQHHSNANDHANTLDHAQSHTHASHTSVGADDHHATSHTDSQHSDGPNSKTSHTHTHAATTGQTANDHHAQSHTMSQHSDGPYGGGASSTTRAFFLS